jgi:hypothetical protein
VGRGGGRLRGEGVDELKERHCSIVVVLYYVSIVDDVLFLVWRNYCTVTVTVKGVNSGSNCCGGEEREG